MATEINSTVNTICVCGGGNGAHAAAAFISSPYVKKTVNVLTRKPEKWNKEITISTAKSSWEDKGEIRGRLNIVSSNAADVVPDADLVILCAPAHAHKELLQAVGPYLKHGCLLGTLFGQGGFDWAVEAVLGQKRSQLKAYFGFSNIPWLCRISEYGKAVQLIGPKKKLWVAASPLSLTASVAQEVTALFKIPTGTLPNFMTLTLSPSNQIIHPARYYGIFAKYDGKTGLARNQVQWGLYNEMDDLSAEWLQKLDDELQMIRGGLAKAFPNLDLSDVLPIKDRIISQYGDDVGDKSSLKMVVQSNRGYAGCVTPAVETEPDVFAPAVHSRLFLEDVPFGLCILISLANMLGIEVPSLVFVTTWHQNLMGKEYIKNGQLNPALIGETGTPQAYGMNTLESVVKASLAHSEALA